ncbi:MFS transporter [Streptomyces sp. NBC_00872]|uniref:MFS transporter n=1 Tax=Streptomyces sp. NBC_00872 TaxID=2903686 RepID=UPI0038693729|nr:MFS transporter [Streptomyces sp. NBC_00872]
MTSADTTGTTGSWRAVLRDPTFARVWISQLTSSLGDQMFPFAIATTVLIEDDSVTGFGAVLAARALGMALCVLIGGVVADRFPRIRIMWSVDVLRAVVVAGAAMAVLGAPTWALALLVLLVGAGEAFFDPAYESLLPRIVPKRQLEAANSLTTATERTIGILGPTVAGAVVALIGARSALLFDAATFAASALLLLGVKEKARTKTKATATATATAEKSTEPAGKPAESAWGGSVIREVLEGFREARSRPWVWAILLMSLFHVLTTVPVWFVLLPERLLRSTSDTVAYGVVLAAFSAGALIGGILVRRGIRSGSGTVALLSLLPFGLAVGLLGVTSSVPVLTLAAIPAGAGLASFQVLWMSALQRTIPDELLGRVMSLDWLSSTAAAPVGYALVGLALAKVPVWVITLTGAALFVVSTLVPLLVSGVREFGGRAAPDSHPEAEAEAEAEAGRPVVSEA